MEQDMLFYRLIKKLIGYEPKTSFEEGIEKFVKWYKINKDIYIIFYENYKIDGGTLKLVLGQT